MNELSSCTCSITYKYFIVANLDLRHGHPHDLVYKQKGCSAASTRGCRFRSWKRAGPASEEAHPRRACARRSKVHASKSHGLRRTVSIPSRIVVAFAFPIPVSPSRCRRLCQNGETRTPHRCELVGSGSRGPDLACALPGPLARSALRGIRRRRLPVEFREIREAVAPP